MSKWDTPARLIHERNGDAEISYHVVSRDRTLSLKALGLHTYLMSLPGDWPVDSQRLALACLEGRDAIRTAMAELEKAGLVQVVHIRTKTGAFVTDISVAAKPWDASTLKPHTCAHVNTPT